jgi:enoyl-[acyl-carrier protein] reductase/trans-2-enoyl-CoA reductase (NAD+)
MCLNCDPEGLERSVLRDIALTKKIFSPLKSPPALVVVLGCSTGYGLASRIVAAFGAGAATIGVSFEKAPHGERPGTGTPGYYNNAAFDREARAAGLFSKTISVDAYSAGAKRELIEAAKTLAREAGIEDKIDLLIYSLASPVRTDPATGIMYRSVIKPIGKPYSGKTFDLVTGEINTVSVEPATEDEIFNTVKVMGGEDWELWIDALLDAGLLSDAAQTVAYTYLGPELSWAIYKNGTIGRGKEDLERAALGINKKFAGTGRGAFVSVNKAVVTRSSAVIPIIPLYISSLFTVMKGKGIHEGCIEQAVRLFNEKLYPRSGSVPLDSSARIRLDDLEMREDVQTETRALLDSITSGNIRDVCDIAGFKHDFLVAHGFDVGDSVEFDH